MRIPCAVLTGLLLTALTAHAGESGVANHWKISLFAPGQTLTAWLLKIEDKDGKPVGTLTTAEEFGVPCTLKELHVKDKQLTFVLSINKEPFEFRCQVPKAGAKKLFGSVDLQGRLFPIQLAVTDEEKISLKNAAPPGKMGFDTAKETLTKSPDSGRVFEAIAVAIREAAEQKVAAAELRKWVETALEEGTRYGPAWRQENSLRVAELLAGQKEHSELTLNLISLINKEYGAKSGNQLKLRITSALAKALKTAGKADELAKVRKELESLEELAHQEYEKTALGFAPEKFKGRKKGNRVVLVELFTGAQCGPCVAADLAFDGLERAFTPKEVVLLQYHLHIPTTDALTTPDSEGRQDYYGFQGTPNIFFNGKSAAGGGGKKPVAEFKYNDYRRVVEGLLEDETTLKLTATAVRKGDLIQMAATVEGLQKPGEQVKLRLVLVEEWARYLGSNGLPYHHRVVRALPGGVNGLALTKESGKQSVNFDLANLRKELSKFLAPEGVEDPTGYRKLSLVAFVQDDDTREVLQAIEVPVRRE